MKQKEEVSKFPEESGPVYSSEIRQSKEGMRDASKRDNLLSKHQECLNVLGEILGGL